MERPLLLPGALREELDALGGAAGRPSSAQLVACAEAVDRLRRAVRGALTRHHVTQVAAALHAELGAEPAELAALGVPTDVLACFPAWRRGSRAGFRPEGAGLLPGRSGAGEPLLSVRMHLAHGHATQGLTLMLLQGLLRKLAPETEVVATVPPSADLDLLGRLAREIGGPHGARVRFVALRTTTLWVQDHTRAMRTSDGRPAVLLPRPTPGGATAVELSPAEVAEALGWPVLQSRLHWAGGNVLQDGERCLVGVDTIAENTARLGLAADEVVALLAAEMASAIVVLGDLPEARFASDGSSLVSSGQASYHLDLDVAPLGRWGRADRPLVLLADPESGLRHIPDALAPARRSGAGVLPGPRLRRVLRAQFEACACARAPKLRRYREALEQHGYRVVGAPDLRIEPRGNTFSPENQYFTSCNVVPALHRGRPAVYYLPWGVDSLDRAARAQYVAAGVVPRRLCDNPALANGLMRLHGGLHCACVRLA